MLEIASRTPCALVVGRDRPEAVVFVFPGPADAAAFAERHGIGDWTVAPVAFEVDMERQLQARLARERARRR